MQNLFKNVCCEFLLASGQNQLTTFLPSDDNKNVVMFLF